MLSSKKIDFPAGVNYRLQTEDRVQSVKLVFSTQLCELFPLLPSLWFTSPPPFKVHYIQIVCGFGRGWGFLSPVGYHILQVFNTLYLTRFRTFKIARQVNFCQMTTFCILSISLIFLRSKRSAFTMDDCFTWIPRTQTFHNLKL